jgi:hypothetical protein
MAEAEGTGIPSRTWRPRTRGVVSSPLLAALVQRVAHASQHRTAAVRICAWRRGGGLATRGACSTTDIIDSAALRCFGHVNSLYEEPFFSCRQGGGSPPPAATGSPSPIRAASEQHLHAVLSLVRRTGRRSSVRLASRPSGNRFCRFPNNAGPRRSRMVCLSRWSSLSHSRHLKLCMCGKLFQIFMLLPFLRSRRRF